MKKITRIWHGTTNTEHADEYLKYVEKTGLSDYRNIDGNLSAKILRRIDGNICHFLTVTEWDSYKSIRKFALPVRFARVLHFYYLGVANQSLTIGTIKTIL